MKKQQIYIAVALTVIAILLFITKSKAMTKKLSFIKNDEAMNKFNGVYNALKNAGFEGDTLKLATAQMLHETGAFTSKSNVFTANNNASGIMFINKPAVQKNASKGTPFPASEGKYFYAKFASLTDWAKDFKRILSLGTQKPINATNVNDYVRRLKENKYFTDSEQNYLNGMNRYLTLLNLSLT